MLAIQIIAGVLLIFILIVFIYIKSAPQFGGRANGKTLDRIVNSKFYVDGKFENLVKTNKIGPDSSILKNIRKALKKKNEQYPSKPIETIQFDKNEFVKPSDKIKVCWFGHSSVILNVKGTIILTDPVFSLRASPFKYMGIKRFEYTNQYYINDIPKLDLIVISHDHFDHLDYQSILKLKNNTKKFCVPLGVSAHLERWGVESEKIIELDWWEEFIVSTDFKIISAPARHFSGRAGIDIDYTLWCSWIIECYDKKIFFCGDSGYSDHFLQIGKKYGPFDFTMLECGQYNEGWPFIHMNPEETVQANIDLNGKLMMPIHWGKFKLSVHSWQEPKERVTKEAAKRNVSLLEIIQGEIKVIE